jgi:DNA-binding response OmpR family regulator
MHPIALVLLDRSMPRLSGEAFLEQLRSAGFDLPVLLLTGDPGAQPTLATCLVLKPPRPAALLETIRSLLDQARRPPRTSERPS